MKAADISGQLGRRVHQTPDSRESVGLREMRIVLAVTLCGFGGLFAIAFHQRYWLWRDCFNELGRCFDPATQDVYLEQSGTVYGGLAALFLVLGLELIVRRRRIY